MSGPTTAVRPAPAPPAPSPLRPSTPAAAPSASKASSAPPAVRLSKPTDQVAPGVMDLKGLTEFTPPSPIADFLDDHRKSVVNVKFGNLAAGPIEITRPSKGHYRAHRQPIPLAHPLFAHSAEAVPSLTPSLVIDISGSRLSGEIGLAAGEKVESLAVHLRKAPELIGLVGLSLPSVPTITNKLEAGSLHLGLNGVKFRLGSAFDGTFSLGMIDESVTFDGSANIVVKGLAQGALVLKRGADGQITGKVTLALTFPKNFSGGIDVEWDGRAVQGEGKVGYSGEKLSGQVTLQLMEKGKAATLEKEKKAPEGALLPRAETPSKAKPSKVDYVVFGEGDLAFAFTDWLNGSAHVIVDPKGFVTIIGKITPQKEFILFKQKDYVKRLFKIEARASYGLPVVGNIFIFANMSMDVFANLGPAKFYNIVVDGTYSTDPEKALDFSIRGTLNISAGAGAQLRAEAGAGLEILDHDIKAGAGVTGTAGIKAYAEATPIIGYREKAAPGEDKKGEFFIRGDLEIAAQPFLGLSGDLFVAIETPWWSPLSDHRWTWPLFGKEWPLGGSMGLDASVDYVFGSGQWPKFDLKPAEFSSDKFMTGLYENKAESGTGQEVKKPAKWQEKNAAAASPPPKTPPKGNLPPGKPSAAPPAKAKPPTGKKRGRPADPSARTKEGKSVKQLQEEASKKGKKPSGPTNLKGDKPAPEKKDPTRQDHDEKLKAGLEALEAVTTRYAKSGATREDVVTGVKSVRRKFKVFRSIEVVDGGKTWDYHYVASDGELKGPPKTKDQERLKEAQETKVGDYAYRARDGLTLLVTEIHVKTEHGETVRGHSGKSDKRKTSYLLPYADYGIVWSKPPGGKPKLEEFKHFGGPGQGGQVVIDEPHLIHTHKGTYATPAENATMGLRDKYKERGHLVANVFRGPGTYSSGNIVALTLKANDEMQAGIEKQVRDDIKKNFAVYKYSARPLDQNRPPHRVQVVAVRLFPTVEQPVTAEYDNT